MHHCYFLWVFGVHACVFYKFTIKSTYYFYNEKQRFI